MSDEEKPKKKVIGRPFVEGHPGFARGTKRIPFLKNVEGWELLNNKDVKRILSKYLVHTSLEQAKKDMEDPTVPLLVKAVISSLVKAINKGDWWTVNQILDRCVGKVKEVVEVVKPKPLLIQFRDGENILVDSTVEEETIEDAKEIRNEEDSKNDRN